MATEKIAARAATRAVRYEARVALRPRAPPRAAIRRRDASGRRNALLPRSPGVPRAPRFVDAFPARLFDRSDDPAANSAAHTGASLRVHSFASRTGFGSRARRRTTLVPEKTP